MRGATSLSHCSCSSVGLEREAVKSRDESLSNMDTYVSLLSVTSRSQVRSLSRARPFLWLWVKKVTSVLVAQSVERWSYGPRGFLSSQGSRRSRVQAPPGTRRVVRVWFKESDLRSDAVLLRVGSNPTYVK